MEGGVGKASRHTMDANISAYDLAQSYMVGYEIAIKGGALGIMCAYNMVNGKPSCANAELLETLRGDCEDGCHCLREHPSELQLPLLLNRPLTQPASVALIERVFVTRPLPTHSPPHSNNCREIRRLHNLGQ